MKEEYNYKEPAKNCDFNKILERLGEEPVENPHHTATLFLVAKLLDKIEKLEKRNEKAKHRS